MIKNFDQVDALTKLHDPLDKAKALILGRARVLLSLGLSNSLENAIHSALGYYATHTGRMPSSLSWGDFKEAQIALLRYVSYHCGDACVYSVWLEQNSERFRALNSDAARMRAERDGGRAWLLRMYVQLYQDQPAKKD